MNHRISDGIRSMLLSCNNKLFKLRDTKYESDKVHYMKIPYI